RLPARSAVRTLSATWRLRCMCCARKTTPMPPRPATASILYPAISCPMSGRRTWMIAPGSSVIAGSVGARVAALSSGEPGPVMADRLGQSLQTPDDSVDVFRVGARIEDRIEVQLGRSLGEQLTERRARVPG